MRQVITDDPGNAKTVILNEEVNSVCEIAGKPRIDLHNAPFAWKTLRRLPTRGRIVSLGITTAILATMGAPPASPDQPQQALADARNTKFERNFDVSATAGDGDLRAVLPSRDSADKSVRNAQVTTKNTGEAQQSPEQEHNRSEALGCELTTARRDVELLQRLEQEYDRAEVLEQNLVAARRDVEAQTGLAAKASDEASRLKQVESGAAALQYSLQQAHERAERLEQDLDAARRGLETQAAVKANAEAIRLNQLSARSLELEGSLQKEHERAETLAKELSTLRTAYEVQNTEASEQAAKLRQAESSSVDRQMSSPEERDRTERLEQDLVAARREVETYAALAAKASEEAARMSEAAENDTAELRSLLQQQRARTESLERDLAFAQSKNDASFPTDPTAAFSAVTVTEIARDKPDRAAPTPTLDPAPEASARGDAQPDPDKAAAAARLVARASLLLEKGDIAAARLVLERAADMGSAQASFALADTYDPLVLPKWGTYGTRPDAIKARDLYAKADAAGIKEAKARLDALRSFAPAP